MMPERDTSLCRFHDSENNEASHPLLATCVSEIGELQNWEECLLASQAVSREDATHAHDPLWRSSFI